MPHNRNHLNLTIEIPPRALSRLNRLNLTIQIPTIPNPTQPLHTSFATLSPHSHSSPHSHLPTPRSTFPQSALALVRGRPRKPCLQCTSLSLPCSLTSALGREEPRSCSRCLRKRVDCCAESIVGGAKFEGKLRDLEAEKADVEIPLPLPRPGKKWMENFRERMTVVWEKDKVGASGDLKLEKNE